METQALSIANAPSKFSRKSIRLLIPKFNRLQLFRFARSKVCKKMTHRFLSTGVSKVNRYYLYVTSNAWLLVLSLHLSKSNL